MALIACPECGREISERAPTCPQCGYPLRAGLLDAVYSVILMDTHPNPGKVRKALCDRGLSTDEAQAHMDQLPSVLWHGLTLREAYRCADVFEDCGLVKVIEDVHTATPEEIEYTPPVTRPDSYPVKPLTFWRVAGAVFVGLLLWNLFALLLSAFFH